MTDIKDFCKTYGVEREATHSIKWDGLKTTFGEEDLLPMWVADMEFKAPAAARQALIQRAEHGVFGYTLVPDSYYEAFFKWQEERYQTKLKKEWIRFSTGVVNAFFWLVQAFSQEQDSVIVLSPVYYPFYDAINDTKRKLVTSDLVNNEGRYSIDFEDFENKIIENQVKIFIHCSPHNPVSRVWTKAEMTKLLDICLRHDVLVISDEIHQDLTAEGVQHVGALALDEKYQPITVVLNAPSKTFNMAGLLHSHVIIPDQRVRQQYDTYVKTVNKAAISSMGMLATEACYREGAAWLAGLQKVIDHNYAILEKTFREKAPKLVLTPKEGTYLAWLDLRAYVLPEKTKEFIQEKCGLAVDFGEWFGEGYEGFIRINLGTLPEYIETAAERIVTAIHQ